MHNGPRTARPRPWFALAIALTLGCGIALPGCSHAPKPSPETSADSERREDSADDGDSDEKSIAGMNGLASYYATKFEGRKTASGAVYHRDRLTAAHRTLPFGTRVRVTRLATGKSVELEVNDRGPFRKERIIDVSRRAAEELDLVKVGVARVRVDVLERPAN